MGDTTLHTGTETTSGTGSSFTNSGNNLIGLYINVSAVSGTLATLTVTIQQSPNGTDWYAVNSFSSSVITTMGLYLVSPTSSMKIADFTRCSWTIGGLLNPSFTFSADLECN